MALVHILREDAGAGRIEDDVEEAGLVKTEGVIETEQEYTTWVEYRFPGSATVVHRSVHVTIKQWPDGWAASASTGAFG